MKQLNLLLAAGSLSLLINSFSPACAVPITREDPYKLGCQAFAAHNYRQAAGLFELAMQMNPGHAQALYYDAMSYQQMGETEHARALYNHVLNVFPRSDVAAMAHKALLGMKAVPASVSSVAGAAPAAVAKPAVAGGPPPEVAAIDATLQQAANFVGQRREQEAEKAYLEGERLAERMGPSNPKLGEVLGSLGDFYANRGETDKACRLYRRELHIKELTLDRRSTLLGDCMMRQATAYTNDGQFDQAEQLLQRSLSIFQSAYDQDERRRINSKPNKDKMVGCMSQLAGVLRKLNRIGDAKLLEFQVRTLTQ